MSERSPRYYQAEGVDAAVTAYMGGLRSALIAIATGGGKTVMMPLIVDELERRGMLGPSDRILILAHRRKLLQQAQEKFADWMPHLDVGIECGELKDGRNHRIVGASIQTVSRISRSTKRMGRLDILDPRSVKLVIVDEAHRTLAETYMRVLQAMPKAMRLGFTATPFRGDGKSLSIAYEDLVYQKTLHELIRENYLARIHQWRRATGVDISGVAIRKGDYKPEDLERAVNTTPRNDTVVSSHFECGEGGRSIVFCAGVDHCKTLTEIFKSWGAEAAYVVGETPDEQRDELFQAFHDGEIRVLLNVDVCTEGYDEPLVQNAILARPTQSPLVHAQQVGRAARKPDEKEILDPWELTTLQHCNIVDIADAGRTKKTMSTPRLMGINSDVDCDGEDLLDLVDAVDEATLQGRIDPSQPFDPEELVRVDDDSVFMVPSLDPIVRRRSRYAWQAMADGSYFLPLPENSHAHLFQDPMGRSVVHVTSPAGEKRIVVTECSKRLDREISAADAVLADVFPNDVDGNGPLSHCEWRWAFTKTGKGPASIPQKEALRKWRVRFDPNITRGEASLLLYRVVAARNAKKIFHT